MHEKSFGLPMAGQKLLGDCEVADDEFSWYGKTCRNLAKSCMGVAGPIEKWQYCGMVIARRRFGTLSRDSKNLFCFIFFSFKRHCWRCRPCRILRENVICWRGDCIGLSTGSPQIALVFEFLWAMALAHWLRTRTPTPRSSFTSSRCCKWAVATTSKKLAMEPLTWSWVMFLRIR